MSEIVRRFRRSPAREGVRRDRRAQVGGQGRRRGTHPSVLSGSARRAGRDVAHRRQRRPSLDARRHVHARARSSSFRAIRTRGCDLLGGASQRLTVTQRPGGAEAGQRGRADARRGRLPAAAIAATVPAPSRGRWVPTPARAFP